MIQRHAHRLASNAHSRSRDGGTLERSLSPSRTAQSPPGTAGARSTQCCLRHENQNASDKFFGSRRLRASPSLSAEHKFLAVVACGRLPRAPRPGPRAPRSYTTPRPTFWSFASWSSGATYAIAPMENDVGGVPEGWRKRGPGRGALGSRPQATTAKKTCALQQFLGFSGGDELGELLLVRKPTLEPEVDS
jgi:hypothetical protein